MPHSSRGNTRSFDFKTHCERSPLGLEALPLNIFVFDEILWTSLIAFWICFEEGFSPEGFSTPPYKHFRIFLGPRGKQSQLTMQFLILLRLSPHFWAPRQVFTRNQMCHSSKFMRCDASRWSSRGDMALIPRACKFQSDVGCSKPATELFITIAVWVFDIFRTEASISKTHFKSNEIL